MSVLDTHCGSAFWNWSSVWYTDNPDLTECFQKTVLVWIPCGFLWLYLPYEIYSVKKHRRRRIPWTLLNGMKLFLSILLALLSAVEVFHWVALYASYSVDVAPVNYYSNFIKFITYIAVSVLIAYHRLNGVRSSGFLFSFWIIVSITATISLRTCLIAALDDESASDVLLYTICVITYPVVFAQLILSSISDAPPIGSTKRQNVCPINNASLFSRLTFSWFDKMALLGFRRSLTRKDLWLLNDDFRSDRIFPRFYQNWEKVKEKELRAGNKSPSVLYALGRTFWVPFVLTGLTQFVANMSDFIIPIILGYLIDFISSDEPAWRGYFYCGILFFTGFAAAHFYTQQYWISFQLGMRLRAAVISLIYRKAINISGSVKRTSSTGEIVNLMSIDVEHLHDVLPEFHTCWVGIIQVAIAFYMLWVELGPSVFASLATLVLMVPINAYIASKYHKVQAQQMKYKDHRIKLMNEILAGIKVLKLYAWEKSFFGQLTGIRNQELKMLKTNAYLIAFVEFLYNNVPIMVTLTTFITYVLVDETHVLDAKKVFVSISLFNILRFPLLLVPMMIVAILQASVSLKRLSKFFNAEELDPKAVSHNINADHPILIEDATLKWDPESEPVLKNINLVCPERQLVAVLGPVGSGKSSLISAILGEMEKQTGYINVKGSVAYVAQQAWIQNASLRDNITFGSTFNQNKYDKIIDACALKPDLALLPAGDQTEIGEKGINLSGGQKQRVSLARAIYNDLDIYLMDDPLSAVDAHVGKHIFDNVIGPNGLLKRKTRLFVTNGISHLHQTDCIVVLDKGAIGDMGSYDQLINKKGAFAEFLETYLNEHEIKSLGNEDIRNLENLIRMNSIDSDTGTAKNISFDGDTADGFPNALRAFSRSFSQESTLVKRMLSNEQLYQEKSFNEKQKVATLIEVESTGTGNVRWTVYWNYIKSLGTWSVLLVFVTFAASTAFNAYSNVWLSEWSQDPPERNDELRNQRLGVYGALGFSQVLLLLFGCLALAAGSIRASRDLHNSMLTNILRSPLSFFDTTPLGRVLNRFSKDIDLVDGEIAQNIYPMLSCLMQAIAVLVIICMSTPLIISVVIPMILMYYFIQRFYIATSRQLKRLEFVAHSPIFSQFSETLCGTSTIRAYKRTNDFIRESERLVDEYHACAYPSLAANRWLGIRLSVIGQLLNFFAALFAVLAKGTIDPGTMGLTVSYASTEVLMLIILVRTACELEANIVAVERIVEYTQTPREALDEIESTKPVEGWPQHGIVNFQNYSTRYRPGLDLVLDRISCDIQQEEKIGIVGRTGAGKSSLALALFRIIEPSNGKIIIDGVDTTKLGLTDLRSRLTVIPQDPVLFSGSLRMNLDPFDKYSDEQVWQALEHSHLKSFVSTLPLGLQHVVSEGGENLSVGQRQLVCLARALLRKSKVLLLDEATAAVDLETDEVIQATIRKEFADCTVITIAHRLNTIMDSTRIMVLDSGRIKEFDTPDNLLRNPDSLFYNLAKDAGIVQ